MALFGRVQMAYHQPRQVVVKKVYALPARRPRSSGALTSLDVLCNGDGGRKHPLPCRMKYVGGGQSHNGQPLGTYGCSICGARKAFVRDFQTGGAKLLFQRPGR